LTAPEPVNGVVVVVVVAVAAVVVVEGAGDVGSELGWLDGVCVGSGVPLCFDRLFVEMSDDRRQSQQQTLYCPLSSSSSLTLTLASHYIITKPIVNIILKNQTLYNYDGVCVGDGDCPLKKKKQIQKITQRSLFLFFFAITE
jgi:hypothetical protein